MELVYNFVRDFSLGFVVTSCVALAIWVGRRKSLDGNASSVSRKHFSELSRFSQSDQERILHAADRKAFSGWRFVFPPLAYAALLSGSIATICALHDIGVFRDSFAGLASAPVIIVALGSWLGRRREVKRIRPFLHAEIEKLAHTT